MQRWRSIGFAGQAIIKLLHKAAGAAEANSRQALETAQKLSSQLRAAEDRIAELEAEVQHYREKSERAEEWLRKISMEIEDRLINEPEEKRRQMSRTRLNHEIELRSMTEDENRPATLHNGAVSTDFPTLQDAIMAWHRLRPEQARTASIRIIGGELYAAAEIPQLLNGTSSK